MWIIKNLIFISDWLGLGLARTMLQNHYQMTGKVQLQCWGKLPRKCVWCLLSTADRGQGDMVLEWRSTGKYSEDNLTNGIRKVLFYSNLSNEHVKTQTISLIHLITELFSIATFWWDYNHRRQCELFFRVNNSITSREYKAY